MRKDVISDFLFEKLRVVMSRQYKNGGLVIECKL